jgi:hypothetical protein
MGGGGVPGFWPKGSLPRLSFSGVNDGDDSCCGRRKAGVVCEGCSGGRWRLDDDCEASPEVPGRRPGILGKGLDAAPAISSSSDPSLSGREGRAPAAFWSHLPSAPPVRSTSTRDRDSCAISIGFLPWRTAHSPTSFVNPGMAGPASIALMPTSAENACGFTRTGGARGSGVDPKPSDDARLFPREGLEGCGDGGRERYGDRLGSGGSPKRIS